MKHAAELDLMAYEDPVFYDRLERARVQATDRLGMIQSIGRLVQQVITAASLSVSILGVLALAFAVADCWVFSRRFSAKATSLSWDMPRTFGRPRFAENSTTCAYWEEAGKPPRNSNFLG